MAQGIRDSTVGRDHNIDAFTMWLAGGGVKRGQTIGTTDEIGCLRQTSRIRSTICRRQFCTCWGSTTNGLRTASRAAISG